MKRLIIILSLILIFSFLTLQVAYLLKPVNLTINLDDLKNTPILEKKLVLKAGWGQNEALFGINKDGWLPGPMSLAADFREHLYILDQENKRIKEYASDGQLLNLITIDSSTYEDLAIDNNGFIYLLDPVNERIVRKINKDGDVIRTYAINKSIEPISGISLIEGQVYVEVEHNKLFKVGYETKAIKPSLQKARAEEGQVAEEFTTDADLSKDGEVTVDITGTHRLSSFKIIGAEQNDTDVYSIISIDSDKNNNLFIVLDVARTQEQFDQAKDKLLGLVIDQDGKLKNRFYASNDYYTSHFRKIAVSPNGNIYQLQTTSEGVVVWKW